ncbi:MAG: hypothetical protein V3U76_19595 [Granulosicoccus sp.]
MSIARTTAILSYATLLSACSGSGSDGEPWPLSQPPADTTLIDGSWLTECLLIGGNVPYQQITLAVTDDIFQFDNASFTDSACTEKAQEVTTRGRFTALSDQATTVGGIPLELRIDQVTLTPLLSPVADSLNRQNFCGFNSWVPEVSLDVSNCPDSPDFAAPRTDNNIYVIDNGNTLDDFSDDTLFLGASISAATDEQPVDVDLSMPYSRESS